MPTCNIRGSDSWPVSLASDFSNGQGGRRTQDPTPETGALVSTRDRGLRDRIRARIPITFLELLPGADCLYIEHAIEGKNSVEVIDFVLQEFGKIAILPGLNLDRLAAQGLILHANFAMAFDLHEDGEKAQAGVPDDDLLPAARDDLGVYQRPGPGLRQLEEDHALEYAQLRSGNTPAIARGCAPVRQRVSQVRHQFSGLAGGGVAHPRTLLPQERIAELQDGTDGHVEFCRSQDGIAELSGDRGVEQAQQFQFFF